MSSNLLKKGNTCLHQEDARVIDTNELVAKRISAIMRKMNLPENEGFISGLNVENIEVEHVLGDAENPEGDAAANVIKAGETAEELRRKAQEEADAILAKARAEAEALIAQTRTDLEQERSHTLAQAKEQGYQEGAALAQEEFEKKLQELQNKSRQLEQEYQQQMDELEPQFVDTITGIYEHIFHVELRTYREILTYLISTTMRKIETSRDFIVHVSKEDYPYISMQKKQLAAGATASGGLEIVEDLTLSKSECFIETEGGIFDCGMGTQLTELRQKLKLLSYERG